MACGSSMHPLFQFSKFFGAFFEPFMSFLDFTRFIFDFLLLLAHISLWMVFILVLRFLEFYLSNDPKFEVGIMKSGKSLHSLKFGSADGPRVRGGWSAVRKICSPEALQKGFQSQQ